MGVIFKKFIQSMNGEEINALRKLYGGHHLDFPTSTSHEDLEMLDTQVDTNYINKKAMPVTADRIVLNYREAGRETEIKKGS